jgi:hypothetical protein
MDKTSVGWVFDFLTTIGFGYLKKNQNQIIAGFGFFLINSEFKKLAVFLGAFFNKIKTTLIYIYIYIYIYQNIDFLIMQLYV